MPRSIATQTDITWPNDSKNPPKPSQRRKTSFRKPITASVMGGSQELIRRRNLLGFKPAKALSDPLLQYRREVI